MPAWLTILLCIVFLYAGYLIGGHINKKRIVGTIVVDKINPEVNGGIYTVWDERELNDYSEPKPRLAWFYSYKRCAEAKADPQCVGGPIQLNPFSME